MKVQWNNKTYQLKLPRREQTRKRSNLHTNIKNLLKELLPQYLIYEEVRLPGVKLTVDFYLPELNLMLEAQGEQHYSFIAHFHKNKMGLLNSKKRDLDKRKWCEQNQIELKEIKYDRWESDLRRAINRP